MIPIPCADGWCVLNSDECRPVHGCLNGKWRCADGTCRWDINSYKCPENFLTDPQGLCLINGQSINPETGECGTISTWRQFTEDYQGCVENTEKCFDGSCWAKGTCPPVTQSLKWSSQANSLLNKFPYVGKATPNVQIECDSFYPIKCQDGTCAIQGGCSPVINECSPTETTCDGTCWSSTQHVCTTCPWTAPIWCIDGTCVWNSAECPLQVVEYVGSQVVCFNGQLKSNIASCVQTSWREL